MNFKDFIKKYNLKNASTNSSEITIIINEIGIQNFGIYLSDGALKTKQGLINFDNKKGTHWVCYYENNYFDSYGRKPDKRIIKQLREGWYSTYKIQSTTKKDSYCASYCLYILYLIHEGYSFKSAVLNLFFQHLNGCK